MPILVVVEIMPDTNQNMYKYIIYSIRTFLINVFFDNEINRCT